MGQDEAKKTEGGNYSNESARTPLHDYAVLNMTEDVGNPVAK